jgi:AcrR family transcriptional regulator
MTTKTSNAGPRERILNTASELFYKQGYRATGVNEVIRQSGVAKATFYSHFPAKDDLCLAYLELHSQEEKRSITEQVAAKRTPRARFMAVVEAIQPWLEDNDLRGCEYLNTVAEIPDPENPLRRKGRQHYEWLRAQVRALADELIESDRRRYGRLKADALADDYMVILVGAIALCEVYHDTWPIRHAIKMVANLVD